VLAVDGREVVRLAAGVWDAGPHELAWSGDDRVGNTAPAGVYFVRLVAGDRIETRRFVRIR
jgi:flagellar hook assembly protein FlgD